jgi:hypothetical protein
VAWPSHGDVWRYVWARQGFGGFLDLHERSFYLSAGAVCPQQAEFFLYKGEEATSHWKKLRVCRICHDISYSRAVHGNSPSQLTSPAPAQFTCLPHGLRHLELWIQQTQRKSRTHKPSIPRWKSIYWVLENGDADFVIRRGFSWSRRLLMVNKLPSPKSKHGWSISAFSGHGSIAPHWRRSRLEPWHRDRNNLGLFFEKKKLAYLWRYWSLFFQYIHISYLWSLISHASMPQCLQ